MSTQEPSMADFSDMIDAQLSEYRHGFNPGERVSGTVVEIGERFVVLDIKAKREGILAREELMDKEGELLVSVGSPLEAYFIALRDGAFLMSTRVSGAAYDTSLRDAAASGMPVEGLVKSEINGGYEITIGSNRAFCPYSQINIFREEGAEYVGQKFTFLVTEYAEEGRNIVLSRRALMEREREADREDLMESLKEGDLREGRVVKLMDFGVFVDLGGAEGLIPMRELSWERDVKAEDIVKPGDTVGVIVQSIDWEKNRISLSLRYASGNPWDNAAARYIVGSRHRVTITRLMAFGAFAELEPGVEGLLHVSKLGGGRRIHHAREVVAEGDQLEVQVESFDADAQRIGLSPVDERIDRLSEQNSDQLLPGTNVTGIVESIREFGVFVKLSAEKTGLLHISETGVPRVGSPIAQMGKLFSEGSDVSVVVKSVEGDRISLTTVEKWGADRSDPEAEAVAYLSKQKKPQTLGSLGDLFDGLEL